MRTIGIIGGGASGLAAAVEAGRAGNVNIFLLEHKDKLGKKLLATGNGRCNLTNEKMGISCFRSETPEIVREIIERFGYRETLEFFDGLGLVTKSRGGYIYPRCDQASAVLRLLLMEIERLGIVVHTGVHVTQILCQKKGFCILAGKRKFYADKVILAAGGRAGEKLGSDGSGYEIAKSLGHSLVPVVPALVQLKVRNHPLAKAAGVRTDAKVSVYVDGRKVSDDTGELQITAYGISGIPVFQISRYAARALYEKRPVYVEADFFPAMEEKEFCRFLVQRREGMEDQTDAAGFLTGIFHDKLIPALLKASGIPVNAKMGHLTEAELVRLTKECKRMPLKIADTNGFDNAQVCAGGVRLTEIDVKTMESRRTGGLYLTGELLDADGICGGYNLQWAWATGCLAGRAAGRFFYVKKAKERQNRHDST